MQAALLDDRCGRHGAKVAGAPAAAAGVAGAQIGVCEEGVGGVRGGAPGRQQPQARVRAGDLWQVRRRALPLPLPLPRAWLLPAQALLLSCPGQTSPHARRSFASTRISVTSVRLALKPCMSSISLPPKLSHTWIRLLQDCDMILSDGAAHNRQAACRGGATHLEVRMRSRKALKAVGSRWSSRLPRSSSACMGLCAAAAREPLAAWEPGMALTAGGKCGLHSNRHHLELLCCLRAGTWQTS